MTPFAWTYLGLLLAGLLGATVWFRCHGLPPARALGRPARVIAIWHGRVLLIVLCGALLGSVLFPVAGLLLRMELTVAEMILNGVKDGGFYALIWAPGVAFIWGVTEAHRKAARSGEKDFSG